MTPQTPRARTSEAVRKFKFAKARPVTTAACANIQFSTLFAIIRAACGGLLVFKARNFKAAAFRASKKLIKTLEISIISFFERGRTEFAKFVDKRDLALISIGKSISCNA